MMTSISDVVLWCNVQLTKDGAGICFPDLKLDNSSNIANIFPNRENKYVVDGVSEQGYFPIDFTLKELSNVSLIEGIYSRSPEFDTSMLQIMTVDEVFTQNQPSGFWLNVQHNAFFSQHNLSMRSFVLGASKTVMISHISSPEVGFLRGIATGFAATQTKLIFRFLDQDDNEPSTNQTYGSLLKNLTFIKTFASGILVPKTYVWPVDTSLYLQPHTSVVKDAHKIGLEVFAADFANDAPFAYNYSYDPVAECLSFIDNGEFSVDGVLSDFPITPSEAIGCFAHLGKNTTGQAKPLVISHNGASGDYPDCTDMAYKKALSDRADVIDCPVQMSKDGIPFCSSSIDLLNNTMVSKTQFGNLISTVNGLPDSTGIFSFSLNWSDIQGLTPVISNPFLQGYTLLRNPEAKNDGKLISLSDFLALTQNASSLSGILIKIQNAAYLAQHQGLDIIGAVTDALSKSGYNNQTTKRVMIQSTDSAVLEKLKGNKYELVYEVDEEISDAQNSTIMEIKNFANSVVVNKESVFPRRGGFINEMTDIVSKIQSLKLPVYVQILQNEFVSQPYDFFSDATVEINSFSMGAGVDGVITDFPKTAARYKKNRCLSMKETPLYMSPVQPGQLVRLISPISMPPAEAPFPVLNDAEVTEPPLPAVVKNATNTTTPPAASAPKASSSNEPRIMASAFFSWLYMLLAAALLF